MWNFTLPWASLIKSAKALTLHPLLLMDNNELLRCWLQLKIPLQMAVFFYLLQAAKQEDFSVIQTGFTLIGFKVLVSLLRQKTGLGPELLLHWPNKVNSLPTVSDYAIRGVPEKPLCFLFLVKEDWILKVGTACLACHNTCWMYLSHWVQALKNSWKQFAETLSQLRLALKSFHYHFTPSKHYDNFLHKSTVSLHWSACLKRRCTQANHSPPDICVSLIDERALLEPKAQSIPVLEAISKNNRLDPVRKIQIFPVKWAEPEI